MKDDPNNLPTPVAATLLMAISSSLFCGIGVLIYVLVKWSSPIWTTGIRLGGLLIGMILLLLGIWLMRIFIKKNK